VNFRKRFLAPSGAVKLGDIDPAFTGAHASHHQAAPEIARHVEALARLQYRLFADGQRSLLIVLQGLDASGKDGAIRHVFTGMNPQGVQVTCFKQPTPEEAKHDFLWRAHRRAPAKGEIMIFNRSHYEEVLVVRVHSRRPKSFWLNRYQRICEFERLLTDGGTRVLKFYLHITPEEQLSRFKERLDDPQRNWKIAQTDYTEREHWPAYIEAFEEAISGTTTADAPWYVIPSNHKWFRNLAISSILVDTLEEMNLQTPKPTVDLRAIRSLYHSAKSKQKNNARPGLAPGQSKAQGSAGSRKGKRGHYP
jgi:PPK2 family polyphosphate:nucleotide phosphotransferase